MISPGPFPHPTPDDKLAAHRALLGNQLWTPHYLDNLSRAVCGLVAYAAQMADAYRKLAGSGELPQVQDNIERYLGNTLWPLIRQLKSRRNAVAEAISSPLDQSTITELARKLR